MRVAWADGLRQPERERVTVRLEPRLRVLWMACDDHHSVVDREIDGMQDFDTVIRRMIEDKTISLDDGLSFATNQNNLLLQLKGLASTEDFVHPKNGGPAVPTVPQPVPQTSSVLDMIE